MELSYIIGLDWLMSLHSSFLIRDMLLYSANMVCSLTFSPNFGFYKIPQNCTPPTALALIEMSREGTLHFITLLMFKLDIQVVDGGMVMQRSSSTT